MGTWTFCPPGENAGQAQLLGIAVMFTYSNASRPPTACTWLEMPVGWLGPGGSRSGLGPFALCLMCLAPGFKFCAYQNRNPPTLLPLDDRR